MSLHGDFDVNISVTEEQIKKWWESGRQRDDDPITAACNVALKRTYPKCIARNRVRHLVYIQDTDTGKGKYQNVDVKRLRTEEKFSFDDVVRLGVKPQPRTGILDMSP